MFNEQDLKNYNKHLKTYMEKIKMSETKTVNLTEDELKAVMNSVAYQFTADDDKRDILIERLNYLNKRLKAFKEETKPDNNQVQSAVGTAANLNQGWGQTNG
jgi:hypothetical protein